MTVSCWKFEGFSADFERKEWKFEKVPTGIFKTNFFKVNEPKCSNEILDFSKEFCPLQYVKITHKFCIFLTQGSFYAQKIMRFTHFSLDRQRQKREKGTQKRIFQI